MHDVIIIGAGPAGTAAGYDLASAGLSVLILDRRNFPRKKACAGGITPKGMAQFAYDISSFVHRTCREVKITRPCGNSFLIKNKDPLCYMTRRMDLDAYTLEQAVHSGCRFMQVDKVTALEHDSDGVRIKLIKDNENTSLQARFLVGSDGANSRVRTLLGLPRANGLKLPALEADVRVKQPGDYPMEFDFSKGIPGYYWIFPKHDHVNIGIFGTRSGVSMTRERLTAYAKERLGTDLLEDVKGYPIGVSRGKPCSGKGRVLLAGDAAGMAEPLFGEGIYFALKSGRTAARTILQSIERTISDSEDIQKHYIRLLKPMSKELQLHQFGALIMYRFPGACLSLAANRFFHNHFSCGYAQGQTISQMLSPF